MALVKCKECGNDVSTTAQACPKCGAKVPKGMSLGKKLLYGFFGLVAIQVVVGIAKRDEQSPKQASPSTVAAPMAKAQTTATPETAAFSCPDGSQKSGAIMRVSGSENFLRERPDASASKIINKKSTEVFKEIHYITIDRSTVVRQECIKGEWSRVRVTEPSYLSDTHHGWVKTAALRAPATAGGKQVFTEADFSWDKKTSPYKAIIVAGVNKVHRENARCSQIDPSSAALSTSKGTKADPVFYVTCGEGAGVFNVFFSKSDVEKGVGMAAAQHIDRARGTDLCEAYVKSNANHPSTVDFSRVMDLQVIEHPNGRTTINTTFTAKNSYNLETKHKVRCLLNKGGLIEAQITEAG